VSVPQRPTEPIPIHQRSYATEVFAQPDGTMRVHGRLTDTKPHGLCLADGQPLVIHDMAVDLYVDPVTFEIVRVAADMDVRPYDLCPAILESYQQLVGVSIARGYSRKVKELFGGPGGCSHMGALLVALGPVAVQASWSVVKLLEPVESLTEFSSEPAERERRLRMNLDTCHVWADGSENIEVIRRGERPRRPDWESRRLGELGVADPAV
jgi:hypothetical protein